MFQPPVPKRTSPASFLVFDVSDKALKNNTEPSLRPFAEYLYPLSAAPEGSIENGIAEVQFVDNENLLVLETAKNDNHTVFSSVVYLTSFEGAENVLGRFTAKVNSTLMKKRAVLKISEETLGFPIDKMDCMTLGPAMEDGYRLLLIGTDNDYLETPRLTQMLAYTFKPDDLKIALDSCLEKL